jgi:WhiB family redox-sensing transcriptional regulator
MNRDWQVRSRCAQTDPLAFVLGASTPAAATRGMCARCDVRAECLESALAHDDRFGIWRRGRRDVGRRRIS